MKIIIKLFPEIIVKSRPVRQRLIRQLRNNVRRILSGLDAGIDVSGSWDRLVVNTVNSNVDADAEVIERLARIPGIHHFLCVEEKTFASIDDISAHCIPVYAHKITGKTFCVRVKRSGRHSFTSSQVEREVGAALYRAGQPECVRMKNPDVLVSMEIRADKLYLVAERYAGLGGYPLGAQESCLSLISGGFDSTVSSYLMMRRGIRTHFCFFNLGGMAHEVGVKQVSHYLWNRYGRSQRVHFLAVPFAPMVEEILTRVNHSYRGVVLKRMMMRAASTLASRWDIPGLVTGESVGQVSSQTMTNLALIDRVTPMMILRPLVTWDKEQIIDLCRVIGTEDFARTMPEFCGVISDRPHTAAKLEPVLAEEAGMDMSILEHAIAATEVTSIDKVLEGSTNIHNIEVVNTPAVDDVVIDIRTQDEVEKAPLALTNNRILTIPFYELARKMAALDPADSYLLYCERGIMSQMQAVDLHQKGFTNLKVYRPG